MTQHRGDKANPGLSNQIKQKNQKNVDFSSKANSCNFRDFFRAKLSVPGISEPNVPLENTGESRHILILCYGKVLSGFSCEPKAAF
jgi:hypothetical protein